ncbi:hypothetical protein CA603_43425 [Paraburkholderia hospita]|nr:hypothetical protein CA603_43425 [Paraburkholderia hospita]
MPDLIGGFAVDDQRIVNKQFAAGYEVIAQLTVWRTSTQTSSARRPADRKGPFGTKRCLVSQLAGCRQYVVM